MEIQQQPTRSKKRTKRQNRRKKKSSKTAKKAQTTALAFHANEDGNGNPREEEKATIAEESYSGPIATVVATIANPLQLMMNNIDAVNMTSIEPRSDSTNNSNRNSNKKMMLASEYIRQIRNENNPNDSDSDSDSDSGSNSDRHHHNNNNSDIDADVEDPLYALLNLEAKDAETVITFENDERVFDDKIFEDEEFKQYKKNNIPIIKKRTKRHRNANMDTNMNTNTDTNANNYYHEHGNGKGRDVFLHMNYNNVGDVVGHDDRNIVHKKTHTTITNDHNSDDYYHDPDFDQDFETAEDDYYDAQQPSQSGIPPRIASQNRGFTSKHFTPNFFIALQITDTTVKRRLRKIQNLLVQELYRFDDETQANTNDSKRRRRRIAYEKAIINPSQFHITLNAFYLENDEQIVSLMESFREFGQTMFQKLMPTKLCCRLHLNRLKHFKERVLYIGIEDDAHGNKDRLQNVFHSMHTMMNRMGVQYQQSRFEPHLTIMKMSKLRSRNGNQNTHSGSDLKFPAGMLEKFQADYPQLLQNIGYQYVSSIQLLNMTDERKNVSHYSESEIHYYQCLSTIEPRKLR